MKLGGAGIDLKLRLTLREGSIYYFEERSLTSPEPPYFIVVNSDPLTQQVLLLSVVTSQVESVKLRRRACPEIGRDGPQKLVQWLQQAAIPFHRTADRGTPSG